MVVFVLWTRPVEDQRRHALSGTPRGLPPPPICLPPPPAQSQSFPCLQGQRRGHQFGPPILIPSHDIPPVERLSEAQQSLSRGKTRKTGLRDKNTIFFPLGRYERVCGGGEGTRPFLKNLSRYKKETALTLPQRYPCLLTRGALRTPNPSPRGRRSGTAPASHRAPTAAAPTGPQTKAPVPLCAGTMGMRPPRAVSGMGFRGLAALPSRESELFSGTLVVSSL